MSSSCRWGPPRVDDDNNNIKEEEEQDEKVKQQEKEKDAILPPAQQQLSSSNAKAANRKRQRLIVDDDDSEEEDKQKIKKENGNDGPSDDDDDDDPFRDTPSPPPPPPQHSYDKVKKEEEDCKPPPPPPHTASAAIKAETCASSSAFVAKAEEAFQNVTPTAATISSSTIITDATAAANTTTTTTKYENNNESNNSNDMFDMSPCSCYASLEELQRAQDFEIMDTVEWGPGVKDDGYDSDQELAPRPKKHFNDPCGCAPPEEEEEEDSIADDANGDGNGDDEKTATRKKQCICCCLDDSCINFATYEECRYTCSAGAHCGNQRLQLRNSFPLTQIFDAGKKGLGMRVLQDVKKGTMITEYTGRAVKESVVVNKLFQQTYQHERRLYIMALEDGIYLDARQKGGLARFINHSCAPNCRVERWKVNGRVRAAVVAICDVSKMTELTFDYQWRRQRGRAPTKCYCGAPNCRGTLEVSKSMQEEELDKSLEGHWITKREFLASSTSDGKLDKRIVNRTIRVFSKEHQQYFLGEVTGYNPDDQLHQVLYQPELKQSWEDLQNEEEWMILDETVDQPFRIAKKSSDNSRRVSGDNTASSYGSNSLFGGSLLTASAVRQGLAKHYLYVQTPVREALCCNPKNFMLENVQRNCAVQVTWAQFARPPLPCNPYDPEEVEKYAALDKSNDGTVWKLSISGNNLERAHSILTKNTAFLEKKLAEQQAAAAALQQQTSSATISTSAAVAAIIAATSSNSYHPPVPRPLAPDTAPTITDTHEVIYPRMIADQVKRKLGAIRDKCRNVSISFAASESKSKRISRLMLEGNLESDLLAAKEELWNVLVALCLQAGAPMSRTGHVPRDLGFLGGALSKEQFHLLLNSSNISKPDNNSSNGQQSQHNQQQQQQRNNSIQYLNQHANEDFNQSPLLASFESFNKCAVWVQSEEDMGRIDSSHRIVADANSTNLRKVYFGCHPSQVFSRWGQLQSRAADLSRGVRFLYLGADRVYMGTGQQAFFDQVRSFTGAAVTVDNMTGDHLRVDGRDAILPIVGGSAGQPMQLGGSLPRGVHSMSQEQRTSLAEEMVRLQIELYRDHCTREQNWLFGRDWTINTFPVGTGGVTAVVESMNHNSSSSNSSANMAFGKLDNKSAAQSCMEIAEVVANLGLDKRVGAHAAIILYRFVTTSAMDTTNLKAREALLACVFLANKAQKLSKWRKLEAVLQAGYKAFYPGTRFDPEKEEALNLEEKVIAAEKEILIALEYDIFVREVDSLALALMNSMVKWKKKKEFVDGVFALAFSGQMLGAGEELWVKYGLEYVFAAAAAFLKVDLKALLSKLPLVPGKVCYAAELMTKSAKLGRPVSKAMPSHPLVEGGKELLEKYIPGIKASCSEISDELKHSAYAAHGDEQLRHRIIKERNRRRSCIRGIPRNAVQESILSMIDSIATDYGCSIFVSAGSHPESSHPETDDIELVGSWRSVALADHLIRSKMEQGFYLPPAVDVSGESPINPAKLPTKTKTRGGLLKANDIGLDSPENSDTFRLGGKSCVAGKISKDAVRSAGLQWWIFPKHGPTATGALCDSFLMRSNKASELEALALLASSTVGDLTAFPILASFGGGPSCSAGSNNDNDDRMLAISVQRWPPEKMAAKEEKRIGKSKRRTMQMGFSAAALQEMQLLTQLHRLIPSPQGHPNFILPVGIAVPDEKEAIDAPVLRDDPMFSLFRSSAENEKAATKEKQVKTFPHLVFQKTPFVLQKFLSRKHGVDDLMGSSTVVAAWFHDLISALVHCHSNQVLLRELQPDQIAVDHTGVAKLTSLYRSRVLPLEEGERSANLVREISKAKRDDKKKREDDDDFQGNSYVAPEMLLGCPNHSKATDCWTIGCILAHLLLSKSLFAGKDRSGLLLSQYKVVGTPAKKNFEDGVRLPHYSKPLMKYPREVEKAFAHFLGEENTQKFAKAIDLVACLLHLDPAKRCTATEALNHEFMVEYVENCNESSFRQRYVTEWTALKQKLLDASESGLNTERRLKRKALLLAAAVDKDKDEDDLYDLDDILGDGAVAAAAKKRKSY